METESSKIRMPQGVLLVERLKEKGGWVRE
jgi:hypothetical protein